MLELACEEIIALKAEVQRLRALEDELKAFEELYQDRVTVETFWRGCAEQALRLWERAQDENDELQRERASLLGLDIDAHTT